jgi:hypothetical protein
LLAEKGRLNQFNSNPKGINQYTKNKEDFVQNDTKTKIDSLKVLAEKSHRTNKGERLLGLKCCEIHLPEFCTVRR